MEMVKRLFWKEAIRSWPLLLLGLLLPVLAFGGLLPKLQMAFSGTIYYRNHADWLAMGTLGVLLLAVTAWSVMTAASERFRASYLSVHSPVPPALAPVIGFGLQVLLGAVLGLCAGLWFAPYGRLLPIALMLYVACGAGVGFLLTMAISPSAGFAAGVFWMLGYIVKFSETLVYVPNQQTPRVPLGMEVAQNSGLSLLALAAALVILLLSGRLSRRARQAASVGLLAAVLVGFPVGKPMVENWRQTNKAPVYSTRQLTTPDGVLMVNYLCAISRTTAFPKELRVGFSDFSRQWHGELAFDCPVLPVGFIGHNAVILARQQSGEQRITLLRWDHTTAAAQPLFSFTTDRGTLLKTLRDNPGWTGLTGSISPNGQYGLLALSSPYGGRTGKDIWLLDLARRRAKLVIPAVYLYQSAVGWTTDRAVVSMDSSMSYQIGLAGGTVTKTTTREER